LEHQGAELELRGSPAKHLCHERRETDTAMMPGCAFGVVDDSDPAVGRASCHLPHVDLHGLTVVFDLGDMQGDGLRPSPPGSGGKYAPYPSLKTDIAGCSQGGPTWSQGYRGGRVVIMAWGLARRW